MLLCVHPSLSLCMCVDAFVHVSACIFIVHAGPEVAVGMAQKQIQDIGKGVRGTPGSVWGRSGGK